MARKKTEHYGANVERSAIVRKVRALMRGDRHNEALFILEELLDWIQQRNERYRKRKGGL